MSRPCWRVGRVPATDMQRTAIMAPLPPYTGERALVRAADLAQAVLGAGRTATRRARATVAAERVKEAMVSLPTVPQTSHREKRTQLRRRCHKVHTVTPPNRATNTVRSCNHSRQQHTTVAKKGKCLTCVCIHQSVCRGSRVVCIPPAKLTHSCVATLFPRKASGREAGWSCVCSAESCAFGCA